LRDIFDAEVKDRRSQSCVSAAVAKHFNEVAR
jgi:hypothetical protein